MLVLAGRVRNKAYECKTKPDCFAFRKATNARPSRPVPSRSRLLGSGVTPMNV
jgi:hypothetical protein